MISLVVPAYNEGTHLIETLKAVPDFVKEIIVIDDGSTDRTYELTKQYAKIDSRIKLIHYPENKGKGYALKKGAASAKYNELVFMDASQFNPKEIKNFKIKENTLIIGQRSFSKIPFVRKISNLFANVFFFTATGHYPKDCQSGFRAMLKKDFEKLGVKENRYAIEPEMAYRSIKNKMKIKYISVSVTYENVPSSISNFRSIWQIITFFVKANLGMIK